MKKMLYLILAVMTIGGMVSCSSSSSSPGAAAKKYAEYLGSGEYDKFIDGIYFGENTSKEEIEQGKTMLKALLADKGANALEEKGGLKSVEVASEEISEDGKSATVVLKQTYGDGSVEEDDSNMVLVNGKWLMEMDK